jgi:hypothetical protein
MGFTQSLFYVIVAAVERVAHLSQFVEVCGHHVLYKVVRLAAGFLCRFVQFACSSLEK